MLDSLSAAEETELGLQRHLQARHAGPRKHTQDNLPRSLLNLKESKTRKPPTVRLAAASVGLQERHREALTIQYNST